MLFLNLIILGGGVASPDDNLGAFILITISLAVTIMSIMLGIAKVFSRSIPESTQWKYMRVEVSFGVFGY